MIDDDPLVRMILAIELPDVELLEATRLEEGYELARAERPDAVIVDVRLPDGDGIDLVRRLRRTHGTNRMPILVLTAGHDEARRAEVMRAGADEYMGKPFEADTLLAHLHELLAIPGADRKERRADAIDRLRSGGTDGHAEDGAAREAGGDPESRRRWPWSRRG